jgi:histidinol dehydrogenase
MASRDNERLIRVLKTDEVDFETTWSGICERQGTSSNGVDRDVRKIVERVRKGGDEELFALVRKFDSAKLERLEVTREEWDDACEQVDVADRAAIGKAAMRVRDFHRKRIPSSWEMREEGGAFMGQRVRPLASVGVYSPGEETAHPSSVIMNAIPPSVVEVPEIIMATPPRPDGGIRPELLMAARVAGVHRVFKMGGPHAIAAMAYGTELVPRVEKIVGSGGARVAVAKRLVFGRVGLGGEAGPGELCIVADRSATPAWVAADLLSQAEQEPGAQAILITHARALASRVRDQLVRRVRQLEREGIARESLSTRGVIAVTRNLAESIRLADAYAPEHLILAVDDPDAAIKLVNNAGAILLGHYTPVAVGDYLAGPNHVLPTGGTARFCSPLGIDDFLKRTSFIRMEPSKLRELGGDVIRLAAVEGFTGHGASVDVRLQKIRRARREREAAREAEAEL